MRKHVVTLRKCSNGWRVFHGEHPLYLFRHYEAALATARTVAFVRLDIGEVDVVIEAHVPGEEPRLLSILHAPSQTGSPRDQRAIG